MANNKRKYLHTASPTFPTIDTFIDSIKRDIDEKISKINSFFSRR